MKMLTIFNEKTGKSKNINLTDNKITSPALLVQDSNGKKYYGMLLNKIPNYPTIQVGHYYLNDIEVNLGSYTVVREWRGSGSGGHQSSWDTVQNINNHGFVSGIKFEFNVIITAGNYDGIGFHAHIKNKHNPNKVIKLSKYWGTGDNWTSNQSYTYTFTKKDLDYLGGPNTEITMTTMVDNNTGGSKVYTKNIFKLTTY